MSQHNNLEFPIIELGEPVLRQQASKIANPTAPEIKALVEGMLDSLKEGIEDMKTISYTKLVPYLVDTIQVMDKRIKELEKKVK